MESIWQKTSQPVSKPTLTGDISTEIAIIGGGLTGILTAHYLTGAGREVTVLEARRVGSGQATQPPKLPPNTGCATRSC